MSGLNWSVSTGITTQCDLAHKVANRLHVYNHTRMTVGLIWKILKPITSEENLKIHKQIAEMIFYLSSSSQLNPEPK